MTKKSYIKEVLLTPELAAKLLKGQRRNRGVKKDRVDSLSKCIVEKKWRHTPKHQLAVGTRSEYDMLDGQHRCLAVIKTGIAVWIYICYDYPDNALHLLDDNRPRSFGDRLAIAGVPHSTHVASLTHLAMHYEETAEDGWMGRNGFSSTEDVDATNKYGRDLLIEASRASDHMRKATASDVGVGYSSTFGAIYVIVKKHAKTEALKQKFDTFLSLIQSGRTENETIHLIRNRLLNQKKKSNRLIPEVAFALIVKAWNAYAVDESMKQLKVGDQEAFPRIYVG